MIKRICGNCWHWNPTKTESDTCKECNGKSGDTSRKRFYPRELTCPVCDEKMIMYKFEYAKCPDCGTKVKPFADPPSDGDAIREEFEKQLPCQRNEDLTRGTLISAKSQVKSGSKSKGSSKKQLMQKKSTSQLYNELAGSTNKINVSGNRLDAALKKANSNIT
jgi:hypothetical protein